MRDGNFEMNEMINKGTTGVLENLEDNEMRTEHLIAGQSPERSEISPLTANLAERTLVNLALHAVHTVDCANPGLIRIKSHGFQSKMMLTLLSYCYANGVYGSKDVERAIHTNAMARYICAREFPEAPVIRKFRQENRHLIEQCLTHLFTQAWALKLDEAETDFLGYAWFENDLNQQITSETRHRLEIASFIDLMDRED